MGQEGTHGGQRQACAKHDGKRRVTDNGVGGQDQAVQPPVPEEKAVAQLTQQRCMRLRRQFRFNQS